MSVTVGKTGLGAGSEGASLRYRRESAISRNQYAASSSHRSAFAPTRPGAHPRSSGFTLLEVLAAIALLAFAFAIGLRAMSGALHNTSRGAAMTAATLEAQSLLDMQGLTAPLRASVQQGRFADGAAWRLRVSAYQPPATPHPQTDATAPVQIGNNGIDLFRIDLDVNYDKTRVLHFATLRAQQAQQAQQP